MSFVCLWISSIPGSISLWNHLFRFSQDHSDSCAPTAFLRSTSILSLAQSTIISTATVLRIHPRSLPNDCCSHLASLQTSAQVFPVIMLRCARHGPCSSKSARDGRAPRRPNKVPRARSGGVYPKSRRAHGRSLSAGRPGGLVTNGCVCPSCERFGFPSFAIL